MLREMAPKLEKRAEGQEKMVKILRHNPIARRTMTLVTLGLLMLAPSTNGLAATAGLPLCRSKSCVQAQNHQQNQRFYIPVQFSGGSPVGAPLAGWHLVRTPGPQTIGDIVSIMRTADLTRSDPDFAGLAIRCRPKAGLQVAFVVITPFHPRSHPKVAIMTGRTPIHFQADVIPPGSMIALPDEAEVLAKGLWQSSKELTVDIEGDEAKIHGVVSLEGLSAAIAQLQASCP